VSAAGDRTGRLVYHLGDGRWWDAEASRWRDGWGSRIRIRSGVDILGRARRPHVVLAAVQRDHDTADNADANLAAFCQRDHMIHDRPEHQRRRRKTLFRRKAMGDPFGGPYARDTAEKAVSYPDRGQDCGSGHRSDRRRRSCSGQLDVSRRSKAWAIFSPGGTGIVGRCANSAALSAINAAGSLPCSLCGGSAQIVGPAAVPSATTPTLTNVPTSRSCPDVGRGRRPAARRQQSRWWRGWICGVSCRWNRLPSLPFRLLSRDS